MRIEANILWKIIISLVVFALVLWAVIYLSNKNRSGIVPAPDQIPQTLSSEDRLKLLESLKAPDSKPISNTERAQVLKSLKSGATAEVSSTDREKLLNSLKAQ